MKYYLKILKFYYKIVSFLSPKLGGRLAFKLFQKVRKKDISKREISFYEKARHFRIPLPKEDLHCYEFGDPTGELIFLVHGWDSNAGSLSKFAFELEERNYRVISFDLPGHANSKSEYTNLYECKEAFKKLIKFINPQEPFTIISHSFGSAMTAYTMAETNYTVDKFVFLTTPNSLLEIFTNFKNFVGITDKTFSFMLNNVNKILKEDVHHISVEEKLKHISFTKLLLVHDKKDKILPYRNSEEVLNSTDNTELKSYERIGHYRMLWNDDVLEDTLAFIKN